MTKFSQKNWLLVFTGVWITLVVIAFARLSYGVVLPYMKEGLSITYQEAGFLGTATSFGYLVMVMFAGILSAKWGEKQSILLGVATVALGFTCLSFTGSFLFGMFSMCLLGIGTAFTFTPLVALLTAWFPDQRGLVIGYINGGAGLGVLVSGFMVPYINEVFPDNGWNMVWAMFACLSILVFFLSFLTLINPPGTYLNQPGEEGHNAIHPRQIYTNPQVILIGLIYGIVGITFIVQATFTMSYMLDSGVPSQWAGFFIAINGVLSVLSAPILGGVSDRIGRRKALILAMSINLGATLIPVLSPTGVGFAITNFIMGTISTGLVTLVQALSTEQVHPRYIPIAFGYVTFYFALGQLVGPMAAGWLIDYQGFNGAFSFSAVCLGIGLLLTLKLKGGKRQSSISPLKAGTNAQGTMNH